MQQHTSLTKYYRKLSSAIMLRPVLPVSLVLFLSFLLLPLQAMAELPFKTSTATLQNTPQQQTLDAVIEAVNRSTVSSETKGRIIEINFDVNDSVKEGEVLMRITSAEQQAGLSAAKAGAREAEARFAEAESEYTRIKDVYGKKLVAKAKMDQASANLKATRQRLNSAQAKLKRAGEKLKYRNVRAPFSGVVVERLVQPGEAVLPGTPVMTGISLSTLRAVAQAPQSVVNVARGKPDMTVSVPGAGVMSVPGSNVTVKPEATTGTHSFEVRARLPENAKGVLPGMLAKLSFVTGESQHLVIDTASLVQRSELTAVYVVDKDRVSFRQIRIGRRSGDSVEVLSGLTAGEVIALDPVRAGIYVREQRLPVLSEAK